MNSSKSGGLAGVIGIIGIAGCAAEGIPGAPSGGGCAARGGKVDATSVFIRRVYACFGRWIIGLASRSWSSACRNFESPTNGRRRMVIMLPLTALVAEEVHPGLLSIACRTDRSTRSMSEITKKSADQKVAEAESFRKNLGPFVVAAEATRMAIYGRDGTPQPNHFRQ
jgi:hypothetical protein